MKDILNKLIDTARQWREFSKEAHGWECYQYKGVWCYFADRGDHSSVKFNLKHLGLTNDQIQVNFFIPPSVDGLTIRSCECVDDFITEAAAELNKQKDEYAKKSDAQKEKERQERIEGLRQKLNELEATS